MPVAGIVPVRAPSVSQNDKLHMVQSHRIRLGPQSRKVFSMGLRDLFEGPHAVILILVVVALFGWKRLPDIARGLGRSMRIFKSEMDEMKTGGRTTSSPARSHTAEDETVPKTRPQADGPTEVSYRRGLGGACQNVSNTMNSMTNSAFCPNGLVTLVP